MRAATWKRSTCREIRLHRELLHAPADAALLNTESEALYSAYTDSVRLQTGVSTDTDICSLLTFEPPALFPRRYTVLICASRLGVADWKHRGVQTAAVKEAYSELAPCGSFLLFHC